jgi:hypothetical protein
MKSFSVLIIVEGSYKAQFSHSKLGIYDSYTIYLAKKIVPLIEILLSLVLCEITPFIFNRNTPYILYEGVCNNILI